MKKVFSPFFWWSFITNLFTSEKPVEEKTIFIHGTITNELTDVIDALKNCKPPSGHVDMVSKRYALDSLRTVLAVQFGRRTGKYDPHGVKNFTIDRTTLDLKDDEEIKFGKFCTNGKRVKAQSKSFKLYYLENVCKEDELVKNFVDKEKGRKWNVIFAKHFTYAVSEIDVTHDTNGESIEYSSFPKHKIILATGVGFDLSAHRLTGVHFGDFLRYLERVDGEKIKECKNAEEMELWKDAINRWCIMGFKPYKKYKIKEDLLKNDYKLQFGVLFSALKDQGVKIPVLAAIG